MARVQAAKAIEKMRSGWRASRRLGAAAPLLVVVIRGGPGQAEQAIALPRPIIDILPVPIDDDAVWCSSSTGNSGSAAASAWRRRGALYRGRPSAASLDRSPISRRRVAAPRRFRWQTRLTVIPPVARCSPRLQPHAPSKTQACRPQLSRNPRFNLGLWKLSPPIPWMDACCRGAF
jgi:hypothetical protein